MVVLINDCQRAKSSPVFKSIRDEVHRPALVGLLRDLKRTTLLTRQFLAPLRTAKILKKSLSSFTGEDHRLTTSGFLPIWWD
jgi:hypothetical protein